MLRKRGYTVEFVAGSEAARRGAVGRTDTAVVVPVVVGFGEGTSGAMSLSDPHPTPTPTPRTSA